jgi:hypothetical protein
MKVVEGAFGDKGDVKTPFGETLEAALEECGLNEETGTLITILDTDDRTTFITNEASKAEVLLLLEQTKMTILGSL